MDVVIITGASSGTGAATARAFAAAGARVGLMARQRDRLSALADELGKDALALVGDVTNADEVSRGLDRFEAEAGPVSCMVNCAGVCVPVALDALDAASWRDVIDVNLTGQLPGRARGRNAHARA